MSGSSGGDNWHDDSADNCDTLAQETILNSPVQSILDQLKKGDVLEVTVTKRGNIPIVQAVYKRKIAGTITSSIIKKLDQCVSDGHEYVAEVLEVKGGTCRVHVHHK